MPEDIYKQDRFYLNLQADEIIWMYHNPDAVSGDQLVSNHFDIDLLKEAVRERPASPESGFDVFPIYDYIGEKCRQYLSDAGTEAYQYDKEMFESEPYAVATTYMTLEKLQLTFRAKEMIDSYCVEEFGSPADYADIRKVGIAYTTTGDDKHEIQVYANLIDFRTEVYLDSKNIANQQAESLADYVENQLPYLDFNELIDIPDWVIEEFQQIGPYRRDLEFIDLHAWGNDYRTCLEVGKYAYGGGLHIDVYDFSEDGLEPFSNLTVNLPGGGCGKNCAFVDTNNFPGAIELIQEYGLGKPTGRIGFSGYCSYPEYEFDPTEIGKHCINPDALKDYESKQKERNDER